MTERFAREKRVGEAGGRAAYTWNVVCACAGAGLSIAWWHQDVGVVACLRERRSGLSVDVPTTVAAAFRTDQNMRAGGAGQQRRQRAG